MMYRRRSSKQRVEDLKFGPRFRRLDSATIARMEAAIGGMAMRLPLIAKHAGHESPLGTLIDYVHPAAMKRRSSREAAQFLIDLVTLPTVEIIEKWYGNDVSAADLLTGDEGI